MLSSGARWQPRRSGWAEWGGDARPARSPPPRRRRPDVAAGWRGEGTSRVRGRGEKGTTHGGAEGEGAVVAPVRTADAVPARNAVAVAGGLATRGVERDAGQVVAREEKRHGGELGTKRGLEERAARSPPPPPPPKRRAVSAIRQFPPGCGRDAAAPVARGRGCDGGVRLLDEATAAPLAGSKDDSAVPGVVEKVASVDGGDSMANAHHHHHAMMDTVLMKSSHVSDENQVARKVGSLENGAEGSARGKGGHGGELLGRKEVLAQAANLLPKRRIVSATRRFPPGCGRDAVAPLAHREESKVGSSLEAMPVDAGWGVSKEVVTTDGRNNSVNQCASNIVGTVKCQELEEGEVAAEACCDVESQKVAAADVVKVMNKCKGTKSKAAAEPWAEGPSKEHFKAKRECEKDGMKKSSMNVPTEVFRDGIMRTKLLLTARKAVKPPLNTLHIPFSMGKEESVVTNSASFGPKKKVKVKSPHESKGIPMKIVSTSGLAGKDNLINEKALSLEDDDILKALAVHNGKLELYLNVPSCVERHRQHGSENGNDRSKIRMLCRRFQFICNALLHAVEQGSLMVRRIDLEADKIIRKLPGFTKHGPTVGNVRGVEVGDEFLYRVELALVGLHRPYQGGIDTTDHNGVLVAISIVASGGYPDELSSSGELIYTGSGGKPAGKEKHEDQKLGRGNLALKNCIKTKTPVRVIHGFKGQNREDVSHSRAKQILTFTYDGLYLVLDCWREGLKGSRLNIRTLGWDPKDGENHLDVVLRSLLLIALVELGHEETINEGVRRFHIFLKDSKTNLLPPDTRKASYLSMMQTVTTSSRGGNGALLKIYRETAEALEKSVKSRILGLPDSGVQSKLDICDHESPSMHDAGKPVTTEEKATEFSEFFAGEGFKPSFERVLKQSLERVRISPRWIESIRPCSYSA
uniref:YDG domain-containing protein n=1 Tax=Oryza rufipogon TaxID=4529 RepID=A0A0E0QIN9_ORYRU